MRNGSLHVVIGIKEECVVEALVKTLIQSGYESPIVVRKSLKLSILQYLEENRDVDVLIIQEGLEESHHVQISEYARFLDLIDNLKIIPILMEETRRDKKFLVELYHYHLLTAVFGQARLSEIVLLIQKGRTRIAARQYYGISDLEVEQEENVDYESSIRYIISNTGTLKERLDFIKKRVQVNDFKYIIKKLPKNILDEMLEIPEYSDMVKEGMLVHLKKGKDIEGLENSNREIEKETTISIPVLVDYRTAVKKVVIGFTGVQEHIGSTFCTIAFAHYLKERKYKVAVLEDSTQKHLSMNELKVNKDVIETTFGFTFQGVDYYPNFLLSNISDILLVEDYNFVLIDFGMFRETIVSEFNRCVIPIIITGSKPWELPYLEQVFQMVEKEEILASYHYLFSFVTMPEKKQITKNMGKLKYVYFADFLSNPFCGTGFPAMEEMIGSYLPTIVSTKKKGGSVFSKMKKRRMRNCLE